MKILRLLIITIKDILIIFLIRLCYKCLSDDNKIIYLESFLDREQDIMELRLEKRKLLKTINESLEKLK